MDRLSHEWERETDKDGVPGEAAAIAPAPAPPPRSLEWASAVGNQAVQRLARRTVAREAVEEEEEIQEGAPEMEPVEEEASAAQEAPPEEAVDDAAPAEEGEPPGDIAPEEAEGLAALDDLPEDELPE